MVRVFVVSLGLLFVTTLVAQEEGKEKTVATTTSSVRPLHRHPSLFGMLVRSNNIRRRVGLRVHRMHPALCAAAQDHANYMARTGQFSHYVNGGPQGRASKYGFKSGVRENIAMGGDTANAFNMWVNSGGHYASIVSNTADAGFGYAKGANGGTYYVGMYATGSPGEAETEEEIAAYLEGEEEQETPRPAQLSVSPAPAPAIESIKPRVASSVPSSVAVPPPAELPAASAVNNSGNNVSAGGGGRRFFFRRRGR